MSKKVIKRSVGGHDTIKKISLENVIDGTYEIVNGVVEVSGSVIMHSMKLTEIPWKFGTVTGSFNCGSNELESLKNAPHTVGEHFYCFFNRLKTLEFCPVNIGGVIHCNSNPFESFDNVPLNILMKIQGIERLGVIKMIPVPNEKIEVVEKVLSVNSKPKKTVSPEERLRVIEEE